VISEKDRLLGRLAVEKGLLTEAQLEACVKEQEAAPPSPRSLGVLLVSKGLLSEQDLVALVEEQDRRSQTLEDYRSIREADFLFGQLLVKHNKATQLQVNKCLQVQKQMAEKGARPVPRLGEILVEHGFVDRATVAEILKLQDKQVLACAGCGRQFNVVGFEAGRTYRCEACGGTLARQSPPESLRADETWHGLESAGENR
jgi:hypothetical protein